MDELTLHWYNTLISGLNLNSDNFQLYQGSASIGSISDWLWYVLDAIPPESINNYYNPNQNNLFSQDYQAVIAQLKPIVDTSFQYCMGDYYNIWLNYLKTATIPNDFYSSQEVMGDFFKAWANTNAPSQIKCADLLVNSYFNDYVTTANNMYANALKANLGFAYNISIDEVNELLQKSSPVNFSSTSSDVSMREKASWTQKTMISNIDFFSIDSNNLRVRKNNLSEKIIDNDIYIEGSFDSVITIEPNPLNEESNLASLKNYLPWYNNQAFSRAFNTKNNTVWKNGNPSWETTFGSSGNIQRDTFGLVIADGINLKMTSTATFSDEEVSSLKQQVVTGSWPFYLPNNNTGQTNIAKLNTSNKLEITMKSEKGNPQLIGVLVSDISHLINSI